VHRGYNGMAGEFGHMQVVPDGRDCECGRKGCWEQYSSGNALVRHARAHLADGATRLTDLCNDTPETLTGPMVTAAAAEGDPLALESFAVVGEWLGVGVANLVAAFDPDVVVIGGGVSDAGDLLLEPARQALGRSVVGAGHRSVPPVLMATLGPEAGAVGAADLVRTTVKRTGHRAMAVGSRARARSRAARERARRR
jgi:glucokinase